MRMDFASTGQASLKTPLIGWGFLYARQYNRDQECNQLVRYKIKNLEKIKIPAP